MHIYFDMEAFSALAIAPDSNFFFCNYLIFFSYCVCVCAALFNAVIVSIMIH